MQEDLAEARTEIRHLKAELREASAGGGRGKPAAPAAEAEAAAAAAAEDIAALKEARDSYKADNALLRDNVSQLERMLQKCQADLEAKIAMVAAAGAPERASSAGRGEDGGDGDAADDAGSARLKEQVKKLKADKRQLEIKEDDLTSQVRKLERDSRRNEASLKAELDALREAYEKLRQRRNRQAGITADATSA